MTIVTPSMQKNMKAMVHQAHRGKAVCRLEMIEATRASSHANYRSMVRMIIDGGVEESLTIEIDTVASAKGSPTILPQVNRFLLLPMFPSIFCNEGE